MFTAIARSGGAIVVDLLQGAKGALLLPMSVRVGPSAGFTLLAMFVLAVIAPLLRQWPGSAADAEFDIAGIPGLLLVPAAVVGLAGICTGWVRASERFFEVAIGLLALWVAVDLATQWGLVAARIDDAAGSDALEGVAPLRDLVALTWFALAGSLTLVRQLGVRWHRWPALLLACLLAAVIPLTGFSERRLVIVEPAAIEQARQTRLLRLAEESVIYDQERLLANALQPLAAQRPGVIDMYFLGIAPYSGQDVFTKELRYARSLFDRRFDTEARSLVLINNPDTVTDTPLATLTSLQRTLDHLGSLIDPDEDFLFIYFTSHGLRQGWLSFDSWPLQLYDLEPARLRAMLDAAGIRRRVVVVSACYSGAFVDAMSDANTLVIAAAAADRTSFGCSNEADFTYFGRAFLQHALNETRSFTAAFARASERVAAQESGEGLIPSLPQMRVGDAVPGWLTRYETALDERPRLVTPRVQ